MAKRTSLLGVLILLLAVQVASAQPPGGGRGRGGFGGGFGGGPGGGAMSDAMLLGIPEVRAELGTKEEQNKQLDKLMASRRPPERPNFEELRDLSDEERRQRIEAIRAKQEASFRETEEKLRTILDEKQLARLNQLRLQRQGVGALGRPDVAKQLQLTDEQRDKMRKIQEASRPEGGPRNFQEMSDEERREFFTQMRERREKADAEILAVLTDEQKTKWNELQGEKFDFPRGGFGGPGGGGFGRGPGGPGGPPQERKRPPRKQE